MTLKGLQSGILKILHFKQGQGLIAIEFWLNETELDLGTLSWSSINPRSILQFAPLSCRHKALLSRQVSWLNLDLAQEVNPWTDDEDGEDAEVQAGDRLHVNWYDQGHGQDQGKDADNVFLFDEESIDTDTTKVYVFDVFVMWLLWFLGFSSSFKFNSDPITDFEGMWLMIFMNLIFLFLIIMTICHLD